MQPQSPLDPRVREALHGALAAHHVATASHTRRAAALAVRMGRDLGGTPGQLEVLAWSAKLHDVGKLCVTPELLDTPRDLTRADWRAMQRHPEVGASLIEGVSVELAPIAATVRAHHERWDGTGYPDRLAGDEIPKAARIIAIADAYDAMTSRRPYQPRLAPGDALDNIRVDAGTHFDPELVARFCPAGHERFVLSALH